VYIGRAEVWTVIIFLSWLYNLNIPSMENGLVLGTLILSYHTKIEINLVETSMTCSCLMILLGN
jgi:hypothetical protein